MSALPFGTEATGRWLLLQRSAGISVQTLERHIPHAVTRKMQKRLQEVKDHLRQDIEKVDEPQLKAMFETSAEVLGGLIKAFRDYEQKNESAWRR
jgi:nitrate/TMAO reductase-like tetraheme cytochrome c subunit